LKGFNISKNTFKNKKMTNSDSKTPLKYLLLMEPEEKFPQLFNSYVFLIMEMLSLAKRLNRVFVLPFIHSEPRNAELCEKGETKYSKIILGKRVDPMESFFDIDEINKYIKTIPFDKFLQLCKKNLSCLCCFDSHHIKTITSYNEKFTFNKSLKINDVAELKNINEPFLGITGYERGKHLVKASPNWHDDPLMDYWEIRKHLVYNKELIKKAQYFIYENLKEKYLAVHWRRGDRCLAEVTKFQEEIVEDEKEMKKRLEYYLIKPIKKIMRHRKLKKVFLATNSGTKWHLDYLKSRLPIIVYPSAGNWENLHFESMVEQLICEKSEYYFSSPFNYRSCSSFSRWIIDSRKLAGRGDDVLFMIKMGDIKRFQSLKEYLFKKIRFLLFFLYKRIKK
jgi:hypothetical protein